MWNTQAPPASENALTSILEVPKTRAIMCQHWGVSYSYFSYSLQLEVGDTETIYPVSIAMKFGSENNFPFLLVEDLFPD